MMSNIMATPGATIKEHLTSRRISLRGFATRMHMDDGEAEKLVNGEIPITFETAVLLENMLGMPASFWLNLKSSYQDKEAQ